MKKKLVIGVLILCNMVLVAGSVFATKSGNVNNTNELTDDGLYNLKKQETAHSQKAVYIEEPQIAVELKFEETPVNIDESQLAEKILYVEEEETLPVDVQQVTLPVDVPQVASVEISTKTIHKVKRNDSLSKIAKKYFGDETKWVKIFEANKDNMPDPHSLYVGQELLIPDVSVEKTETQAFRASVEKKSKHDIAENIITHTVQSGDTLYEVSGKYYNDPTLWRKIYEANEETLEGQDLLRKGQILIIPK